MCGEEFLDSGLHVGADILRIALVIFLNFVPNPGLEA